MFQISPIHKNIQVQCINFKNWINVGSNLDCAFFIGLIEYHIKVNKVEDIKKIYEKAQASIIGKIKTIISNSENQQQRLEYILKEFKQTTDLSKILDQLMGNYFKIKGISNEKDKEKDLKNKVKILEQDFNIRIYIHEAKSNLKIQDIVATTIYLLKYETNYYILINVQENLNACNKCNGQQNIQKLKCNHLACFLCLQAQFEGKNILVPCFVKGCQQKIDKQIYLSIKLPKNQDQNQQKKQEDPPNKQSLNKVEKKQELQNNGSEKSQINNINNQKQQSLGKIEETQSDKDKNQEKGKLQQSIKIQPGSSQIEKQQNGKIEQKEQPIQSESRSNSSLIIGKTDSQNLQQKELNIPKQIKNKKCSHCLKESIDEIFEASCGHCYCPKCTKILKSKNKQYTCLHPKCNDIQKNDYYQYETKCDKCKEIKDHSLLFTNFCDHQICVQCLEELVRNKRNYKCPICGNNLQSKDIELFFENLQFHIYEKEIQIISLTSDQSDFQQQILQQSNNAQYCTFCFSPFTEYNVQQQLYHCQNPLHMIGVCCSIFPLDCPQCQISSLEISKYQITFQISNYFEQNTLY